MVLSPLGITHGAPGNTLQQTLCYPAYTYNSEFLQPYVYPYVDAAQTYATTHPLYKSRVEPGIALAQATTTKAWQPVQPVVNYVVKMVKRTYYTLVHPHIPYLATKYNTLTAPYTSKISAFHKSNVAPHLATAQKQAKVAGDSAFQTYRYILTHPITAITSKYAAHGVRTSRTKAYEGYRFARPHALRAGKRAEKYSKEVLAPRWIQMVKWEIDQVARAWSHAKA
jgi:hypothetical protein